MKPLPGTENQVVLGVSRQRGWGGYGGLFLQALHSFILHSFIHFHGHLPRYWLGEDWGVTEKMGRPQWAAHAHFMDFVYSPAPTPDPMRDLVPPTAAQGWVMSGQGFGAQAPLPRCPGHICLVHCDAASSSPPSGPPARRGVPGGGRTGQERPFGPRSPPPGWSPMGSGRSETS